jgi:dephospho-CoA kinase
VQLGSPILDKIIERYGSGVQLPDGMLNRKRLGEIVFSDPSQRQWLEQQIHPYVGNRITAELDTLVAPVVVVVVPLLFEAGMTDLVTEIWVVSCAPEQQLRRMIERDRLTLEQARDRINSQLPLQEKVGRANVVLENSSTVEVLLQQIDLALLY